MANDLISRQAAIDALTEAFRNSRIGQSTAWRAIEKLPSEEKSGAALETEYIKQLPSAEPEIIRCKDCRWWDKYGNYDNGYCMAAKHGYFSEHWEIRIRRTYKGDFYCADAEPKEEQEWKG